MIRRLGPTGRLSQAVVYAGIVTTSGQVADNPEGKDVTDQMRSILCKLDALLTEAGTDKSHLISAQVWLADMEDLSNINAGWDAWIPTDALPTRTTTQTPMTRPEWRVAVAVTAALPNNTT